ncbi:uncharacterized protein LOC143146081 [Ptiloglossa arizonensis]|uniref:uncharacterized protein LOC143146081 n=1 Tax=Ptiloglossa arizonensis TaxID=3350558 RepID=UPI003F9F328C
MKVSQDSTYPILSTQSRGLEPTYLFIPIKKYSCRFLKIPRTRSYLHSLEVWSSERWSLSRIQRHRDRSRLDATSETFSCIHLQEIPRLMPDGTMLPVYNAHGAGAVYTAPITAA